MFVTPRERRVELDQRFPVWMPCTLSSHLDRMAETFGDRPLMINEQGSFSYADIATWSRRIAAGLIEWGVQPREHVALLMGNFAEFAATKFALARIGAVTIPVNFHLRGAELEYVLNQSDAVAIVTMQRFRGHDYVDDLSNLSLPHVREIFVLPDDESQLGGFRSVADLANLATSRSAADLQERALLIDPHSVCDVLYTSGTTGHPKGVMLTHDSVLRAAFASAYHRAFEDGRRIAHALPMYHVFGYVECLVAATFVGGAVVSHLNFDAQKMVDSILRYRATDLIALPNMTLKILEHVRAGRFSFDHLMAVFNSGGVNPPQIWDEIRELLRPRELVTGYGMTETTASTTCTLPEGDDARLLDSNGCFKLAGCSGATDAEGYTAIYKAIDTETGADLAHGKIGELVVRGPIVTPGYYKKSEETEAAFTDDGWLRTGDLGHVTPDGYVTLTGRIKESYRCGGEMVMPREIEALVETHPFVKQALAIGVPDPKMGDVGCLCVVPSPEGRPDPEALIDMCVRGLARFKVPRHVLFFSQQDIPVTATGRPQKVKLREVAKARLAL